MTTVYFTERKFRKGDNKIIENTANRISPSELNEYVDGGNTLIAFTVAFEWCGLNTTRL